MRLLNKVIFLFVFVNYTIAQTTFQRLYNFSQKQSGNQVAEIDSNRFLFITDIADCGLCAHIVQLIEVNQFGDTVVTGTFSNGNETYASNFLQTGNSFIFPITSEPVSNWAVTIIKVDSVLNQVWNTVFTIPGWNFHQRSLTRTSDSCFIICGNANPDSSNRPNLFILKLNSSGNILWHKIVDFNNPFLNTSVIESENGTLIFTGGIFLPMGSEILIYKTDSLGDSLMIKTFICNYISEAMFISKWRNQFVLGGYTQDTIQNTIQDPDGLVLFLDSSLDSTSSYTFDIGLKETIYSATSDSSVFIFAGSAKDTSNTLSDVFILRFDTNNVFVNYKIINGPGVEYSYVSISNTSDGGLIIGTTSYDSFGYPSALLMKTDINGDFVGVPEIGEAEAEIISPNPSSEKFYINGNNRVRKGVIYSILGEKIREFSGNEIDLSGYEEGIYFYEIYFSSGLIQKGKLIKIK